MTPDELLKGIVETPGALTDQGIAAAEQAVDDAHANLTKAHGVLADAQLAVNRLNQRQASVNKRLTELRKLAAAARVESLKAVTADPKNWKRESDKRTVIDAESKLLTEALDFLVAGEIADAGLAVRGANLAIARASKAWVEAKARVDIANLWRSMRVAMEQDPSITVNLNKGGIVWAFANKLHELHFEIRDLEDKLDAETATVRATQQRLGAVTSLTNHQQEEAA